LTLSTRPLYDVSQLPLNFSHPGQTSLLFRTFYFPRSDRHLLYAPLQATPQGKFPQVIFVPLSASPFSLFPHKLFFFFLSLDLFRVVGFFFSVFPFSYFFEVHNRRIGQLRHALFGSSWVMLLFPSFLFPTFPLFSCHVAAGLSFASLVFSSV